MTIGTEARELLAELRAIWNPRYLTILLARKRGLRRGARIPNLERGADRVRIDEGRLRRYRELCGLPGLGAELPICYPQLLAFPLQLELMTDPRFPLPLLGLIHVRSEITQHRAIGSGELLEIGCRIGEQREARRGFELDLETRVSAGGVLCWESTISILRKRRPPPGEQRASERRQLLPELGIERQILAGPEIGRRYALCSGDLNPIHLHPLAARLFGFRSAIAHGMWSLARSLAELELSGLKLGDGLQLRCDFKLPVLLPATLRLRWRRDGAVTALALFSEDGERPHLLAQLSPSILAAIGV